MNTKGFTLPEVMVALGIFAIGMIASFGLQLSSMATSRKTEQIKTMTEIATSTLEIKRQYYRAYVHDASDNQNCESEREGYTCVVAVQPCELSGSTIHCSSTTATSPVAHYITVTVTAPNQPAFTLSALVRKKS